MRRSWMFLALLAVVACTDAEASIEITGERIYRQADKHVAVEVDLRAHERLGHNIGTYCTQATFAGQTEPREVCSADLTDGDTKTVRIVSDADLPDAATIHLRVRFGAIDQTRDLVAPGH